MLTKLANKLVEMLPPRLQNTGKQFIKFGVTGTIGAIVDFSTYNILVRGVGFTASYIVIGQHISVANNVSVLFAIVSNFLLNKYWTFQNKSDKVLRQWTGYFILSTITWAMNQLLFSLFITRLLILKEVFGSQNDNAAKALAIGVILFVNFFGSKFLVFRKEKAAAPLIIGPTTPIDYN